MPVILSVHQISSTLRRLGLVFVIFGFAFGGCLSGATITVTNLHGVETNPVTNSSGEILRSGFVRLGTFNLSNAELLDVVRRGDMTALVENFVQFGNSLTIGFNRIPGIYQNVIRVELTASHPLVGRPIYSLLHNSSNPRFASELLIYQHDAVFQEDPAWIPPALLNEKEGGTLLVGDFGKYRVDLGPIENANAYSFFCIDCIPEPSSIVLLIVGLGGILLRRSR